MKKLLLLLLLFPSLLFAQDWQEARMNIGVMGGGVPAGSAAPTYVNANSAYPSSGPITLTGVTGGNLLVVLVAGNKSGSAPASVSGSCSSSWVALTWGFLASTNAGFFYCNNASSGNASITITSELTDLGWSIHEYTPGTLEAETAQGDANANPTSGNIITTVPTILVGFVADELNLYGITSSWTSRTLHATHYHTTRDTAAASSGTYAFNPTRSASTRAVVGIAAFKGN